MSGKKRQAPDDDQQPATVEDLMREVKSALKVLEELMFQAAQTGDGISSESADGCFFVLRRTLRDLQRFEAVPAVKKGDFWSAEIPRA